MPYTSIEIRNIAVTMKKEGRGIREISRLLGKSAATISRIIKRYYEEGHIYIKSKPGRPRKTTKKDERMLVRMSRVNPKMTSRQLKLSWAVGEKVSNDTVKRILRRYGFVGRIAAQKPRVTNIQRIARLKWCRKMTSMSDDNWSKVIFSDEAKFELCPRRRVCEKADGRKKSARREIHYKNCQIRCRKHHGLGLHQERRPPKNRTGGRLVERAKISKHFVRKSFALFRGRKFVPARRSTLPYISQHERVLRKSRNCSFAGLASSIARFKHNRAYLGRNKTKTARKTGNKLAEPVDPSGRRILCYHG